MQRRKKTKEKNSFKKKRSVLKKEFDRVSIVRDVWSRGVTRWFRFSLSVADPFVGRCLNSWTMLPSSHPAHRTGCADFPLPALGERITMSPTGECASVW